MVSKRLLSALLFVLCLGAVAHAQSYTQIVVFGDSLSDTGNDATISASLYTVNGQVPGPASGYTNGRFTDGTDTVPAARNYNGVWIEQMAALLPNKPVIKNSLAGGTNYAYGFATTNSGTSTFAYGPNNAFTFQVKNMGQQVADFLATHPTINSNTLFVVWGGANDLLQATQPSDIPNAAAREVALVQALIAAGATDFLIPNLPPLGLVPRLNGSPAAAAAATQAAAGFDQALAAGLATLPAANAGKTLHLFTLDTYTLFTTIVSNPAARGFANVTSSAQGNSTVNPDTYLFWDDLHPTTYGHYQLALAAKAAISTTVATTTTLTSSNTNANVGSSITLTATVTGSSGTPTGTVVFLDGTTTIGTGVVTGTNTTATATITTSSLTSGTHTLSAQFTGVNGFGSSSGTLTQTITVPAPTESLSAATLTIARGSSGTLTVTVTPTGGYTGTATFSCGQLPAHVSCTFSPTSVTLANNTASTSTLTIGTNNAAALTLPALPGHNNAPSTVAFALIPGIGLLGFAAYRRRRIGIPLLGAAFLALTFGAITGCSDSSVDNRAAAGTYTVPVIVTITGTNGNANTTLTQTVTLNIQ